MSRRRSRSRSRSTRVLPLAVIVVVVLLWGATILPAASYTTAGVDRGAAFGVAEDQNAILGLEIAPEVTAGSTDELVVITNRFGTDVTVTVTLDSDSTSNGDLVVDGTNEGDEASIALGPDEHVTIDVDVASETDGDTLVFHVSADGTGMTGTVTDRSTTIVHD
ncbi:hypothetical protein ACYJ1Y_17495 [Natrialbaceae archaeon A-gly3]